MVYEDAGDIHVAATDGTSRVLVAGPTKTSRPGSRTTSRSSPSLAKEGDELLRLMVADSEGGNVRSLLGEPLYQPDSWTWSPDGSQLVVFNTVDNARVISIVDAGGGGALRTLDLDLVVPEGWVDWRPPDGRQLVFLRQPHAGERRTERCTRSASTGPERVRSLPCCRTKMPTRAPTSVRTDRASHTGTGKQTTQMTGWAGTHTSSTLVQASTPPWPSMPRPSRRSACVPDGSQLLVELQQPGQLVVAPADGSGPGISIGPAFAFDHPHAFDSGEAVILPCDPVSAMARPSVNRYIVPDVAAP